MELRPAPLTCDNHVLSKKTNFVGCLEGYRPATHCDCYRYCYFYCYCYRYRYRYRYRYCYCYCYCYSLALPLASKLMLVRFLTVTALLEGLGPSTLTQL